MNKRLKTLASAEAKVEQAWQQVYFLYKTESQGNESELSSLMSILEEFQGKVARLKETKFGEKK